MEYRGGVGGQVLRQVRACRLRFVEAIEALAAPPVRPPRRPSTLGQSRTVAKPAPRLFRPAPPIVAVRGVKPNARHHGDGLFDPLGLRCRWPGECQPGFQGVLDPAQILPTLGNGAIPAEVLTVVREAVTLDPYSGQWLARAGQPETQWKAREGRIAAEHVRLYGGEMTYDGSGRRGAPEGDPTPACGRDVMVGRVGVERRLGDAVVGRTGQLLVSSPAPRRRRSPSPHGVSRGCRCSWSGRSASAGATRSTGGASTGSTSSPPRSNPPETVDRTFTGRSPVSTGIAKSLRRGDDGMARRRERPRRRHTEPVAAQRSRRGVVREVARPARTARPRVDVARRHPRATARHRLSRRSRGPPDSRRRSHGGTPSGRLRTADRSVRGDGRRARAARRRCVRTHPADTGRRRCARPPRSRLPAPRERSPCHRGSSTARGGCSD